MATPNIAQIDDDDAPFSTSWKAAYPEGTYKVPKNLRPQQIKGTIHRVTLGKLEKSKPPSKVFLKTTDGKPPGKKNMSGIASITFDSYDQKQIFDAQLSSLEGWEITYLKDPNGAIEEIPLAISDEEIKASLMKAASITMGDEEEGVTDILIFKTRERTPKTKTIKFLFHGSETA